jgi:hypothetical protein
LPSKVINAFVPAEKHALGMEAEVFGVANALPPHAKQLRIRRGDPKAVESIGELTEAEESALQRRYQSDVAGVWCELGAMGVLYQRGQVFPYWPAWLDPQG